MKLKSYFTNDDELVLGPHCIHPTHSPVYLLSRVDISYTVALIIKLNFTSNVRKQITKVKIEKYSRG